MIAKRVIDILGAALGLMLASPLMLVVALVVRVGLGSPILFRQQRPGLHGRSFEMVKFRTMTEVSDQSGAPLPDAVRLGAVGRVLRATSLDELPELWNVLIGDMSLVGPRPLLTEYLPLYSKTQSRRHQVRPGITGWAQVNGRNAITWDDKLALDVWYVDHRTTWLDIRIMMLTVARVLQSDGISQDGHVTMKKFGGPGK